MGLFSFGKKEAPAAKPATTEAPEAIEEKKEKPELSVVKPAETTETEESSSALKWAEAKQKNLARAAKLFDAANTYFRETAESTGSKKWDKSSPRYQIWLESKSQVLATDYLTVESSKLAEAEKALAEMGEAPEVLLAASGATMEEKTKSLEAATAYDARKRELEDEIAFRADRVNDLEIGYEERELEISKLEAEINGTFESDDQNMWNKATEAYQELVAAEDALAELKKGFLSRFRKAREIAEAKERLAEATEAVKEIDAALDDAGTLRGKTGAKKQLASFKSRTAAHSRTLANTGRGTMTK